MKAERQWWWVVTGISIGIGYCTYGIVYSYGVFFGAIQAEFHTSAVVTGWVQSLCLACSQLFSILGQMLVRRFGFFCVITTATISYAICLLLSSVVPSVSYLYLTYGIGVGITVAISTKPALQLVLEWVPIQSRMRATGLATIGSTIGLLTLSPLIETVLTHVGWRWTFRICSGFVFIVALIAATLLYVTLTKTQDTTTDSKQTDSKDGEAASEVSQREVLYFPEMWIFATMLVIVSCAQGFTMINLVDFATKSGFTLEQGALVLSVNGGAEVVGKIILALFLDKLPFPKILIWPNACIVSSVICVLILYVNSFKALLIVSTVLGLMKAVFNSTGMGVAAELFGHRYRPSTSTIASAPCGLGFLFAALVGGYSYDLTGSYESALYACSGMFFICCILSLSTLIWQKMCAVERFQYTNTKQTRRDETKDCYAKLNIIEDKTLPSQNATQI
ncbi:monocarboxylate transporter 12-B-like [Anneissia japonica]|uniref:monocarboxylate transporter 12-B-like n=1 Tax=Anneissia japonica TaxID=1529436 RepID=UPI001425A338|nr:monocarboxylate transporter 12-B-like [Anneissia japonica]XP_033103456.1 monocarboxylate transporter 12-B-like [Anneissia japonica]